LWPPLLNHPATPDTPTACHPQTSNPVILSEAKDLCSVAYVVGSTATAAILRCHEKDSPPQREEGQGVVGGVAGEWQPPLAPPYQGGESFSSRVVSQRIMKCSLRMRMFVASQRFFPIEVSLRRSLSFVMSPSVRGRPYKLTIHPIKNQLPHLRQFNVRAVEKLNAAVAGISVCSI